MKKKRALALRLAIVLSLFPVSIISAPAANAATAESILCASKNVDNGANVEISYIPGYCVLKFKSGTVTWTVPATVTYIEYLVVAGGGAGGRGSSIGCEAGGGGAGGVLNGSMSIAPSSSQAITIGEGGTTNASRVPGNGGDTTAFSLVAKGGGFGGTSDLNSGAGGAGGSGGGGAHDKGNGGTATSGQGTNGEKPLNGSSGGGGGGATTSGVRGFGGTGLASAITGTTIYYGDGGAGSNTYISNPPYPNITAGSYQSLRGGSGNGGFGPTSLGVAPGNGVANTGSGGAGAYRCGNDVSGGNGGSGVVIVRYPVKPSVNGLEAFFRNDSTNGTSAIRNPVTTGPEFCHYGVYSNVNSDWGSSNPRSTASGDYTYDPAAPASCNNDYFQGFYTGFIKTPAASGTYSFRINADDHVILDIDSATVINNASGAAGSASGTVSLQANTVYPIQIYFQESTGGAAIFMYWTAPGGTEEFVPSANLGTTVGALQSGSQLNSVCSIGLSSACPAYSPQEIINIYGTRTNGTYWLSVNGVASNVYIMMESGFDGGGYVLAMKGANNATTFNYDANYWTRPNVLNTTGSTFLSRNTTDNTDAKFNAFNYLPPRSIVAVFPQQTSTSYAAGGLGSNATYGFSWRETMTANASSYLGIFTDSTPHYEVLVGSMFSKSVTRQLLREATDTDIGKNPSNNTSIFTRQKDVKFFGFNYRQQDWESSGNTNKARWGFGNNENGVNSEYEIERTNDAIGGIGLSGAVSYSAGDYYNSAGNVTQTGINGATKFEMYLKMADPNLGAPTNLTSSTAGNGNISLRWNKPANTIPTEYVIQHRTSGAADWSAANSSTFRLLMPSDSATPTTVISGLSRSTKYEFRVFARSAYNLIANNSSPSSTSVVTRIEMPTNVKVMPVSDTDTALAVTFTGTAGASKHFVQVFSDESATVQVGTTWDTFTSGNRITGLTKNSRYFITVTAANANGDGNSSPTTVIKGVTPGFADWTLKTNTGEYARALDDSTLDFAGDMTMQAWVYPTGNSGASHNMVINKDHSYQLSHANGFWRYAFYLSSSDTTTVVDTGVPVRYDEWHHIAVTRQASNGTVLFYQDGILMQTNTTTGIFTGAMRNSSFPLALGARIPDGSGVSNEFIGQIDQIKLFSSVRTDSEILNTDMTTYGAVDTSNLVAFYDFNEGDGTTVFNRAQGSPAGTDALIQGTPQWRTLENIDATTLSAYVITTFKRSYLTLSGGWKVPANVSRATALVVAGGGAGGSRVGGGGGAGGYVYRNVLQLTQNSIETVTVGQGGIGRANYGGRNGSNSNLGTKIIAIGGGGGGASNSNGERAGKAGGSGGGTGDTSGSGASNQTTSPGSSDGLGNAGAVGEGTGLWRAGGGGGATSAGYSDFSGSKSGYGGDGKLESITGTSICYAAGGGGGIKSGNTSRVSRGNGGTCSGGTATGGAGSLGIWIGFNATANTGSGGGGSGYNTDAVGSDAAGGDGGSGIIVIRWISASAPIFTGPSSDTLTAGMVETFTVSGSPVSPLTRNYRWQVSTDTGTTWVNATTGTGLTSASYVTPTLETTTSGIRYQYRVVVTDSDTAGLFIVETSTATVFLTINPRITITGSSVSLTQKYGETQTVTYTIANGTGTRTTVASPNNRTGITWSSVSGSAATLAIEAGLGFGTYYETLTVTDSVTATTTQMITISVSKADTITVTVDTITALTYTGTTALVNPVVNISGLKSTDTATVEFDYTGTTLTYDYQSGSRTCAQGGTCNIGDLAPGGGKVFYVSPTKINASSGISNGGIYLASAPVNWVSLSGNSAVSKQFGCDGVSITGSYTDTVGSGAENTRQLAGNTCLLNAAQLVANATINSITDWFVPSIEELKLLRTNLYVPNLETKMSASGPLWSSIPVPGSNTTAYTLRSDGSTGSTGRTSGENQGVYLMPIRAFSPIAASSSTAPTNAGDYTVLPVNFALTAPASLSNYQGVTISGRNFTISKAYQAKLTIGQYDAYIGISSYPINVYGGSGSGTITRTLVDTGTAGCALSISAILTATQVGTCSVRAVKDGGINYFNETATATIYWMKFINRYTSSGPTTPTDLGMSGSTGYERRSYETFTVLSFANGSGTAVTSVAKGSVMRIIGTGFNASDDTTEVIIGFFNIPKSSLTFDTTNPLANFVEFALPNSSDLDAGANDVAMKSRKGWAYAPSLLNVTG